MQLVDHAPLTGAAFFTYVKFVLLHIFYIFKLCMKYISVFSLIYFRVDMLSYCGFDIYFKIKAVKGYYMVR